MTKASDNEFPKLILTVGSAPSAPSDSDWKLYAQANGVYAKSSNTTVGPLGAASSGLADPMTTRGDIIVRNASNVTARLAIGSTGKVLQSDGTDISWQTPSAGSGGGFPLDAAEAAGTLNGTYGDAFTGASLNGRWSRHVVGSGEETYQVGVGASTIRYTYSTGAASRYIYQTAPNGTNETWECSFTPWQVATTGEMLSLIMVDSSGNGTGVLLYDSSQALYMAVITSHSYASIGSSKAYPVAWPSPGRRVWLRLRKASGVYHGSYSFNGHTYSPELSYTPGAFTPARIGFGRVLGTNADDVADIHWFDKTA